LNHTDIVHTQLRGEAKGRVAAAVPKEFAIRDDHGALVGFDAFDLTFTAIR
jgi:hypothetical protein